MMIAAYCSSDYSVEKLRTINDTIKQNEGLKTCLRNNGGMSCLSMIDEHVDISELNIVDVKFQNEIDVSSDSLDYCISYKMKERSCVTTTYMYVGRFKHREKYMAYEQYADGRRGLKIIDSLWAVTENGDF